MEYRSYIFKLLKKEVKERNPDMNEMQVLATLENIYLQRGAYLRQNFYASEVAMLKIEMDKLLKEDQ